MASRDEILATAQRHLNLDPRASMAVLASAAGVGRATLHRHFASREDLLHELGTRSLDRWEAYTEAKEAMFFYTDTADAPWTVVRSNDKKRARLEAIRHVLNRFDYENKDDEVVGKPDPLIVGPASLAVEGTEMSPRVFPRL